MVPDRCSINVCGMTSCLALCSLHPIWAVSSQLSASCPAPLLNGQAVFIPFAPSNTNSVQKPFLLSYKDIQRESSLAGHLTAQVQLACASQGLPEASRPSRTLDCPRCQPGDKLASFYLGFWESGAFTVFSGHGPAPHFFLDCPTASRPGSQAQME